MGWGDCGTDSQGRPIGYVFEAECDHPGCHEKINRGLAYACGGMHGESGVDCEKYFCEKHRTCIVEFDGSLIAVCEECEKVLQEEDSGYYEDEEEGLYREVKGKSNE